MLPAITLSRPSTRWIIAMPNGRKSSDDFAVWRRQLDRPSEGWTLDFRGTQAACLTFAFWHRGLDREYVTLATNKAPDKSAIDQLIPPTKRLPPRQDAEQSGRWYLWHINGEPVFMTNYAGKPCDMDGSEISGLELLDECEAGSQEDAERIFKQRNGGTEPRDDGGTERMAGDLPF
jgi:hypothetical protein